MFSNYSDVEKVAIYMRVSTDEQAQEGFSLDAQLKKLRNFCEIHNWSIKKEFVDPGFSGKNTNRPAYREMMQSIKDFDGIVILKMDRIHRNSSNFLSMMKNLRSNNTEFISVMDNFDTSTAMGRFVMNIVQQIAQLESEQNGERVNIANIQKVMDVGFRGHRPARGYKMVDGEIVEDPETLEQVRTIYRLYAEGQSINSIMKTLGISSFGTVRYPLTNIWYAGYEQYSNHFKRHHLPPAVSLDLWNTVQTMRCRAHGKRPKRPFLMSELVDSFTLTDKELIDFGLREHIMKQKVG